MASSELVGLEMAVSVETRSVSRTKRITAQKRLLTQATGNLENNKLENLQSNCEQGTHFFLYFETCWEFCVRV